MRNRIIAATLAGLMLTSSVGDADVPVKSDITGKINPIVIGDDLGGDVDMFLVWYGRVRDSGVPVVIRGLCQSACTLVMLLPPAQICIEPTASLGFHLFARGGTADPNLTRAYSRRYYPAPLQKWLDSIKLSTSMIFLAAADVVRLEIMRPCSPLPTPLVTLKGP